MVGAHKLNEKQVEEIKHLFKTTKLKNQDIAEKYGVSRAHISLIRTGKRWNPDTRSFVTKREIETLVPEFNEYLDKKEYKFMDWVLAGVKKVVSLLKK